MPGDPGGGAPEPVDRAGAFSLRRRLQLLIAVLVAVIVGAGVVALLIIDARDDALDTIVFRLDPAASAALRLDAALVDQQAAVSGFVLIQREDVLEPYQRARSRESTALDELDATLAGTALGTRVPAVRAAIDEWREDVVEPQLFSTRAGREAEARILATTGQELFDQARGEVRQLSTAISERLEEEQASFSSARRAIAETVAVNVMVATLLLVAVTILLRRWVTDPLDDLRAQVAAVSAGDVTRAIHPSGPIELASVGADVEAMRVRILEEVREVRRAEEGLAQSAPAIVTLRDALSPKAHELPSSFSVSVHFEPAEGVLAGDWYQASNLPDGRVALCVGDVAGHGAGSAIVALRTRDLAMAGLKLGLTPSDALSLVSDALEIDDDETFVTCFVAVIDLDGKMSYANAGHPAPFVVDSAGARPLTQTGPLLGPLPGEWGTLDLELETGATVVVFTDGVVEATDDRGEEYGVDRLQAVLGSARGGAAAILGAFGSDFRSFSPDRTRDDVTVVALTRSGPALG